MINVNALSRLMKGDNPLVRCNINWNKPEQILCLSVFEVHHRKAVAYTFDK